MTTPTHIIFNLGLYFVASHIEVLDVNKIDLILLLSAELIDLDHLLAKPIYSPNRNSFKTHFLHKKWKVILATSGLFLLYRPLFFLGLGLISHMFLDYCDKKIRESRRSKQNIF